MLHKSDDAWEYMGREDPYFGVLTEDEYRKNVLTQEARAKFFSSGADYVHSMMSIIRIHFDPSFHPENTLDFGCGVGRLTIPLAGYSTKVIGVDISNGMLKEAQKNCDENNIKNVEFVKSDDSLSNLTEKFNLINSYIVFQHIPPLRGEKIVLRMTQLLAPNGVGVLHFPYFHEASSWTKFKINLYRAIPFLFNLRNVFKKRSFSEPLLQMNIYNLNRFFRILHQANCRLCYAQLIDDAMSGIIVFFQRANSESFD